MDRLLENGTLVSIHPSMPRNIIKQFKNRTMSTIAKLPAAQEERHPVSLGQVVGNLSATFSERVRCSESL